MTSTTKTTTASPQTAEKAPAVDWTTFDASAALELTHETILGSRRTPERRVKGIGPLIRYCSYRRQEAEKIGDGETLRSREGQLFRIGGTCTARGFESGQTSYSNSAAANIAISLQKYGSLPCSIAIDLALAAAKRTAENNKSAGTKRAVKSVNQIVLIASQMLGRAICITDDEMLVIKNVEARKGIGNIWLDPITLQPVKV